MNSKDASRYQAVVTDAVTKGRTRRVRTHAGVLLLLLALISGPVACSPVTVPAGTPAPSSTERNRISELFASPSAAIATPPIDPVAVELQTFVRVYIDRWESYFKSLYGAGGTSTPCVIRRLFTLDGLTKGPWFEELIRTPATRDFVDAHIIITQQISDIPTADSYANSAFPPPGGKSGVELRRTVAKLKRQLEDRISDALAAHRVVWEKPTWWAATTPEAILPPCP